MRNIGPQGLALLKRSSSTFSSLSQDKVGKNDTPIFEVQKKMFLRKISKESVGSGSSNSTGNKR